MCNYLLCEDPIQQDQVFILQAIEPKCLIEITYLKGADEVEAIEGEVYDLFQYTNFEDKLENWKLCIVQYFDRPEASPNHTPEAYKKSLSKAWEWYESYLKWEDKNIEEDETNSYFGALN